MNTQLSINVDQSFLQPALALSLSGTTDVGRDADYWRLGNLSDFSKQDPLSPWRFGDLLPSLKAQSLSQQSDTSALADSSALSHSSSSQTQDGSKKKGERSFIKSTFLNQNLIDLHKELLAQANTGEKTPLAAQLSHGEQLERSALGKNAAPTLPTPATHSLPLGAQVHVAQTAESNPLLPSPLGLVTNHARSSDRPSAARNFGHLQPTSSQNSSSLSSQTVPQLAHHLITPQISLPASADSPIPLTAVTPHPLKDQIVTLAKNYMLPSHNQLTSPFTLTSHTQLHSIIQQTKDEYTKLAQELVRIQNGLLGLVHGGAPSVQLSPLPALPGFERLIATVQQADQEHINLKQQLLEKNAAINLLLHCNDAVVKERDNYKKLCETISLLFQQSLLNALQSTQAAH